MINKDISQLRNQLFNPLANTNISMGIGKFSDGTPVIYMTFDSKKALEQNKSLFYLCLKDRLFKNMDDKEPTPRNDCIVGYDIGNEILIEIIEDKKDINISLELKGAVKTYPELYAIVNDTDKIQKAMSGEYIQSLKPIRNSVTMKKNKQTIETLRNFKNGLAEYDSCLVCILQDGKMDSDLSIVKMRKDIIFKTKETGI